MKLIKNIKQFFCIFQENIIFVSRNKNRIMNNKSIVIILGIVSFIFGLVALQQSSPKSECLQKFIAVDNINVDSTDKSLVNTEIFEIIGDTIKKQADASLKDTLFVKKIISGTELCSISADGIIIDVPVGAVKWLPLYASREI